MTHKERTEQYRKDRDAAGPIQTCALCKSSDEKKNMHPHHPRGRRGENMLLFIWLHPSCHKWVHDNPLKAAAKGLLEPGR